MLGPSTKLRCPASPPSQQAAIIRSRLAAATPAQPWSQRARLCESSAIALLLQDTAELVDVVSREMLAQKRE